MKEGNNPCGLPITDTAFWVYLSINLSIHPWLFLFFLFKTLCFNSQSLFLCCKLLTLYFFFKFCLEETSSAIFFICC